MKLEIYTKFLQNFKKSPKSTKDNVLKIIQEKIETKKLKIENTVFQHLQAIIKNCFAEEKNK